MASWEAAPPRSYGRLVAYLTSSCSRPTAPEAAAYARDQLEGACDSPTSCYALAIAALVQGDDAAAAAAAEAMREGGDAFARAAEALRRWRRAMSGATATPSRRSWPTSRRATPTSPASRSPTPPC